MSGSVGDKTLAEIFADFWHVKAFLFTGMLVGVVAASVFTLMAIPHYRAQMIISPASPMNGADVSSLIPDQNATLRSLMQRVSVTDSGDFTRFENTYAGPSVAALMLKDSRIPEGLQRDYDFSFSGSPKVADADELAAYIEKHVRLEPVGETALRRFVYTHPDRNFAGYFLYRLHHVTDELIRQKLRQEAEQRIRHLQQALTEVTNPDHRRSLTTLLMEQEHLRMLVSIDTPYAAAVVEPPASEIKAGWPDPALVFPGFMAAGALLGFVVSAFSRPREYRGVSAKRWFRTDKSNSNRQEIQRPLSARDAAE